MAPSPAALAVVASHGRWQLAPHLALINGELLKLATQGSGRLIVELPPRHGKSELIGRYFPAWYLGTYPDRQVMYVSYEARQARKYGRLARDVLAEFGMSLFHVQMARRASAADLWCLEGHEGSMATAGVGGPLTGKGAHVLIVDDPTKNSDQANSRLVQEHLWDWWESTALTRLEPGGSVIIVQTRWHLDDLAGGALKKQAAEGWHEIRLPALAEHDDPLGRSEGDPLWPARFDAAALHKVRDNRESYWWLAMYQQRPTQHRSREWPAEYFDWPGFWFIEWPPLLLRVAALDPSQGRDGRGDYSAFALVGEDAAGHLWVDANLERRPAGQIVADGVELCRQFRPLAMAVEGNAWQNLLGEQFDGALLEAGLFDVEPLLIRSNIDKLIRIRRLDRWLRPRQMHFRDSPGGRRLVSQLREFPQDKHDDGPDALEMATQVLAHYRGEEEPPSRIERIRA